jgi:hypothetical protein
MGRTPTGVGPQRTAQVIFMIEPAIAGEVEAWRFKRGIKVRSDQHREIYLAGLAAKREEWAAEVGNPSRAAVKKAAAASVRGEATKRAAAAAERLAETKPAKVTVPVAKPAKRAARVPRKATKRADASGL